jgi:1,4-dihydroxy-2-naphthoate octaprenyltransferase
MYGTGAFAAARHAGALSWLAGLLGCACLFLMQTASAYTTEHFRRANTPLHRGAHAAPEDALAHNDLLKGIAASIVLLGAASGLLLAVSPVALRLPITVMTALGLGLGLGHSAPPLKLSYRGFGEINVAFTHTTFALLLGWMLQGGDVTEQVPHLLAVPAFWAVMAARTVAGIPRAAADKLARRKTYAVIFGPAPAAGLAIFAALAASTASILLWRDGIVRGSIGALSLIATAHGLVLAVVLIRFIRSGATARAIPAILSLSTSFTLWFGFIPFLRFLRAILG